ncbi:hypothetical protein [Thaumasiovibrio subtropicus]|uniref:hypothetical protein n=1 Tax=Thaumasiovibrio subtropicus TaxID=1891207 RepID=UPI00131E7507|nr:hypothetical protein [Thaumasiovibrio subtropicus]
MNTRPCLGFLTMALALSGCQTTPIDLSLIEYGDEQQQVIMMLGEPGDRQFNGRYEVYQYCTVGAGIGTTRFDMVWFYDGKVTAISDYELANARVCERHYRDVDWLQAPEKSREPDQIIEVRGEDKAQVQINVPTNSAIEN